MKKRGIRTERRSNLKNAVWRVVTAAIFLAAQIAFMIFLTTLVSSISTSVDIGIRLLALVFCIYIYSTPLNASGRLTWTILIMILPLFGILLYMFSNYNLMIIRAGKRYESVNRYIMEQIESNDASHEALRDHDESMGNIARYLIKYGGFPVFDDSAVEFYPEAVQGLEAQIEAMKNAKDFIFMEYFAVEWAPFFEEIVDILAKKVEQGVEVRLLYDDVGSTKFVDRWFLNLLRERGIYCKVFNPINIMFSLIYNNRDHRKITVVDGKVAFTGGYNLADEYFNYTSPLGYWKDTGVRIEGPAVNVFTSLFLCNWNTSREKSRTEESVEGYLNKALPIKNRENIFIQPYGDSPLDNEHTGENIFLNIINRARRFVYITTPYLIITDDMNRALGLAAKRGVDVRIVTPAIPDKKVVFQITRSYYSPLFARGVRIYEYTPGFVHAKQIVSDGDIAYVGTENMDYRSLYHHFEDGVVIYGKDISVIKKIEEDFREIFSASREMHKEDLNRFVVLKGIRAVLKLMAPLL